MQLTPLFVRLFCAVLASPMASYSIVQAAPFSDKDNSANITVADQLRTRTGDAGLSRLDENTIGIITTLPAWQESQVRLGVNHTTLNAGTPGAGALFGTQGVLAAPEQNTHGTALQVEIVSPRHLYLQLGTTP